MAINYSDPRGSLNWLLDSSVALPEQDTAAAESAIASGGMAGSPFAENNRLRLRDAERINRLQIGQGLLQPYLQRDFAAQQQQAQIAAQASSDAIRESGAMARLNAEQQGALQRALISGNQQAAHDLLIEAGSDRRQANTIAAQLQDRTLQNQSELLRTIIPYALQKPDSRPQPVGGSYYMHNSGLPGGGSEGPTEAPNWGAPGRGGAGSGIADTLGPVLSKLLASYGLS